MNKPRWACTACGMYSSRKDSVKRHVDKFHGGTGVIVSFIDYLVGRFSGVYVPGIRPTYLKKKAGTKIDYLDVFEREFVRVLAERTVNNYFNSPSSSQQRYQSGGNNIDRQTVVNTRTTGSGAYYYDRPKEVFGYRAVICDKCLCRDALEVYFSDNGSNVGRTERVHLCTPQWVATNEIVLTAEEREEGTKRMRGKLFSYLAEVASIWTAGKPSLIAFKLRNPAASSVQIRHPAATEFDNKTITLQQAKEGIIEVNSLNSIDAKNHWIPRAVKEGQTPLNGKELEEFCHYVNGSKTFGFFKIHGLKEESPPVYLMSITNLQWKNPAANQATDSKTP
jgi:hypothetical protein